MMKKILIVIALLPLLCLSLTCCRTFDGYYYSLEEARSEKNSYESADYVFTKDLDDLIIDFVIKEHILQIIEIDSKDLETTPKYKVQHISSFSLEENIYVFEQSKEYNWENSTKLSPKEYSWCIVSKEFNSNCDDYPSFEFEYEGEAYCLCYTFNTEVGALC